MISQMVSWTKQCNGETYMTVCHFIDSKKMICTISCFGLNRCASREIKSGNDFQIFPDLPVLFFFCEQGCSGVGSLCRDEAGMKQARCCRRTALLLSALAQCGRHLQEGHWAAWLKFQVVAGRLLMFWCFKAEIVLKFVLFILISNHFLDLTVQTSPRSN